MLRNLFVSGETKEILTASIGFTKKLGFTLSLTLSLSLSLSLFLSRNHIFGIPLPQPS